MALTLLSLYLNLVYNLLWFYFILILLHFNFVEKYGKNQMAVIGHHTLVTQSSQYIDLKISVP